MDAKKMHGKKKGWKLNKNVACGFEQILEVTPVKTTAVLTSNLPSQKPSK